MCGIVGVLATELAAPVIFQSLQRLEYRGYDSAGIATVDKGRLTRRRAQGKLSNLRAILDETPLSGAVGIGHTRWATHGAPTERNAHPHQSGPVAIVHNGIIENFMELRRELANDGIVQESETDTEIVVQLVARYIETGLEPLEAVERVLERLTGAFALVFLFKDHPDMLIAARRGSPLAIGLGENEAFIASDAFALASLTRRVTYLEDGDVARLTRTSLVIRNQNKELVERPVRQTAVDGALVEKGNHRHFMIKEIHEQSDVISHTIGSYIDANAGRLRDLDLPFDLAQVSKISIVACGTAHYAALVGKYWFERLAGISAEADIASEFRYRDVVFPEGGITMVVSQSGETADTLAALREAKAHGQKTLAVVNVPESSIAREADLVMPTYAGAEIGVASTKAFTCQLSVLFLLALITAKARGRLSEQEEAAHVQSLMELPRLVLDVLQLEDQIHEISHHLTHASDLIYLGRGLTYPIALEGALKLKEISYIHAEGYAAGELKHGPIALIDEEMHVVCLIPKDGLAPKTISNMQEVIARGAKVILVADPDVIASVGDECFATIPMPSMDEAIAPLLYAIPMQLLAYHVSVLKGTDVDQPRNLAKSVTVE